jgi:outer membrane cobalamin receptor
MIDQPAEIVITARALPPARSEGAHGVAVIGREALERSPSQKLDQIVRTLPGVQLFRRSDSRSANRRRRG